MVDFKQTLGVENSVDKAGKDRSLRVTESTKSSASNFARYLEDGGAPASQKKLEGRLKSSTSPEEKTQDSSLALHSRSLEIGRVIFTSSNVTSRDLDGNLISLNRSLDSNPSETISQFYETNEQTQLSLAEYMRETMVGNLATRVGAKNTQTFVEQTASSLRNPVNPEIPAPLPDKSTEINWSRERGGRLLSRSDGLEFVGENGDSRDSRLGAPKELLGSSHPNSTELRTIKLNDFVQATERTSGDSDFAGHNGGQRSGDGSSQELKDEVMSRENGLSDDEGEDERDNWRNRLADLVQEKVSIALKEGFWSVKLNLRSLGFDSVNVVLYSEYGEMRGEIYSTDPQIRKLLNASLQKLQDELSSVLSSENYLAIDIKIVTKPSNRFTQDPSNLREIDINASEILASMANRPKLDDGLDVFV
ncbi:MAG: hypothetical protein CMK56_04855 [Proteobacteria bacterium]|nr:hypothetical protein [Pseudomonadota bacterium]